MWRWAFLTGSGLRARGHGLDNILIVSGASLHPPCWDICRGVVRGCLTSRKSMWQHMYIKSSSSMAHECKLVPHCRYNYPQLLWWFYEGRTALCGFPPSSSKRVDLLYWSSRHKGISDVPLTRDVNPKMSSDWWNAIMYPQVQVGFLLWLTFKNYSMLSHCLFLLIEKLKKLYKSIINIILPPSSWNLAHFTLRWLCYEHALCCDIWGHLKPPHIHLRVMLTQDLVKSF